MAHVNEGRWGLGSANWRVYQMSWHRQLPKRSQRLDWGNKLRFAFRCFTEVYCSWRASAAALCEINEGRNSPFPSAIRRIWAIQTKTSIIMFQVYYWWRGRGHLAGVGTAGDTFSGDNLRPCSSDIGVKLTDREMEAINQCEALKRRTGLRCSCWVATMTH